MPAFYLTLIAVLLAGLGARDQGVLAALTQAQGKRPAVLIAATLTAVATAAAAGYGAYLMLAYLPPPARLIFAAIAIGMAGLESLLITPRRTMREPTNSLGALTLVLLARQITDAARFVVFGLGVGLAAPWMAAAGGALGGIALVGFAYGRPDLTQAPAIRHLRRGFGALLLLAGTAVFFAKTELL